MKRPLSILFLLGVLVITACSNVQTTPPLAIEAVETPFPGPVETEVEQTEPYPGIEEPIEPAYPGIEEPIEPAYPGPENPGEQPPMFTPPEPSGFESQPGDLQLERGEVFLQLADSGVIVMESYPVQAILSLHGELPDPCHKLRVVALPPDSSNNVQVEVYSVRNPDEICTAVLEPFDARINLGSFAGGTFTVFVNGIEVGTISG